MWCSGGVVNVGSVCAGERWRSVFLWAEISTRFAERVIGRQVTAVATPCSPFDFRSRIRLHPAPVTAFAVGTGSSSLGGIVASPEQETCPAREFSLTPVESHDRVPDRVA